MSMNRCPHCEKWFDEDFDVSHIEECDSNPDNIIDMDDDSDEENAREDRLEQEWESQTYEHYSGDNSDSN